MSPRIELLLVVSPIEAAQMVETTSPREAYTAPTSLKTFEDVPRTNPRLSNPLMQVPFGFPLVTAVPRYLLGVKALISAPHEPVS